MADNDTQVCAFTESGNGDAEIQPSALDLYIITVYTSGALATVTSIYGLISWCVLTKFRNYKNFVFLNVILAILLDDLISMLSGYVYDSCLISDYVALQQFVIVHLFLYLYIYLVKRYWLILICHMFYADIVKVLNGRIQKRYIKSILFAWIVSFLSSVFYMYATSGVLTIYSLASEVFFYTFVIPLVLNSLLYIMVVCTIFRSSKTSEHVTVTSKWRRLYLATLIFIFSDILIFQLELFDFTIVKTNLKLLTDIVLIPLLIYVYFFVVKRNREVWYEFYVNKLNKQRNPDIKTDVDRVRPTTDSQTTIITTL